ncbi:MAG: RagB/SusD family nutrient uptake outer membrane protein, partial [Dysgonamonadaceae bacterium]|nr:RagB/SusD family nutrient uptake outer membrane protein [Dysgonamonadaceae bacterium]
MNHNDTKFHRGRIVVAVLVACSSLFSCSDWLDITPEDTITADKLFSTYSGYHTALNGIYQELSSNDLYGRELSWGFASALSQYYNNNNEPNMEKRYSHTENYEYKTNEVETYTAGLWLTAYNAIANTNNLLQHLEQADINLFPNVLDHEIELIRGEALALRAMLHFDLLRLFAPAPQEGNNFAGIPYN